MKLLSAACSVPWAITPDALRTILQIAARQNPTPEAVAAQLGRPLDNAHHVDVRDGVATIPIDGPIFRHANLFTEVSGATSIEVLMQDLHTALHDPAISSIVLSIDSPGGEVNGTNELANAIYEARSTKPIIAYISSLGASAAYWLAAAADEVVCDATAAVGSIGVVATVSDPSKQDAADIEFVSSQSPNKRPNPTTESGRTQIQSLVDATAAVFIQSVARSRGVSADTVLADFGGGGLFVGEAARAAGLVDRIGSYEQIHAELSGKTPRDLVYIPGGGRFIPASRKQAAHVKEPRGMAGMKDMFRAMFSAMEETEADVPQAEPVTTQLVGTVEQFTALSAGPDMDELKRLRAELAKERSGRVQDNAAAFADAEITGLRAMPAERETLIEAYIQAATDDNMFGANTAVAGPSRVDALKARQAARPAHTLTQEALPVTDGTRAAINRETTPRADAEKPATPDEIARLLSLTNDGKRALATKKN